MEGSCEMVEEIAKSTKGSPVAVSLDPTREAVRQLPRHVATMKCMSGRGTI